MFRSLRNRLMLSHILPLLVAIPLVGLGLSYVLETQVILPRFAENLIGDAKLLAEISRAEYEVWGNPVLFEVLLSRIQRDPAVRVMFLSSDGILLYSSDPTNQPQLGKAVINNGLNLALSGDEVALTNYSSIRLRDIFIDVFVPVTRPDGSVIGVVRLTYQLDSAYQLLWQKRFVIGGVLAGGLLLGALIGLALALSISRPVQKVTSALNAVAQGTTRDPLVEQGPRELREQARALNNLVARLASLEQARRQLLANLVHELGRPLGALRSAIHALSKGAAQDPKLLQDLTTGMDEETAQLQHILEDLAHLHDQNLGTLELKREPLQLGEWLPKVIGTWEQAALEKHLHWEVTLPPDLPVLLADPVRLAQVLGNLTQNAILYTPQGHKVAISAGQTDKMVWISVEDTGMGISTEDQERLFTPFYSGTQGRRIRQGMGLGLSIARDWAEAHGGYITVESTLGVGSKFTIWLPLAAPLS
jgi:two-component system, OmpR family, sensor histidine kinase BaeS